MTYKGSSNSNSIGLGGRFFKSFAHKNFLGSFLKIPMARLHSRAIKSQSVDMGSRYFIV